MNDIRWFAPNPYAALVVAELRRRGLKVALEGESPARVAVAMGGGDVAETGWRYARAHRCPLVLYIWDLPPGSTGAGRYDPVWWIGSRFVRLPRPLGGYRRRRGYFSRLRYIAAHAAEVWVPSVTTQETVAQRFGVPSRRVPYCYDSERFRPAAVERDDPPTLLTVSRLKPHKNQAAVLRAAARLDRQVQVRIIGRGPERDALERLAATLGVTCRIQTDADDAEVTQSYQTAAVVVCPSRFEGFGLTPVEGIASGRPVVVSDIPPHRESVGGAAKFFDLDDDDSLVAAIGAALDDGHTDPSLVRDLTIPAAADRIQAALARHLSPPPWS